MMQIVFATNNQNKFKEIQGLIPENVELLGLQDIGYLEEIEETGQTLEENSLLKAKTIFDYCQLPTIADDTGLEVFALDGEPGVYSARYAGEQKSNLANIDKLLKNLAHVNNRKARFRTVFTFINKTKSIQFDGVVVGEIGTELLGTGGFGYDPVFFPEGQSRTFAQMTLNEKNEMSHRARALKKLTDFLIKEFDHIG